MKIDLPREVSLKILYDITQKGGYSNITINKYLEMYKLNHIDRGFITELVYGTIKWKHTIDYIIQQYTKVKFSKISPWILNIIRIGTYQLFYMTKVPDTAACNESVKLSKKYGHQASSKFVNGILRNISRNKDNIQYPSKDKEPVKYLSIKYSYPEWLITRWVKNLGYEFTESFINKSNEVPETTLRVNDLKTNKEELKNELKLLNIETEDGLYLDDAIVIRRASSIVSLEPFKKGFFQIQDESSMLAVKVLEPKSNELVIDVCSAPGGKATYIAQLMKNKGKVIARDVHPHKIKLIQEAANRLGLDIIETEEFDATLVDEKYMGRADKVLVDAPCSGYGIIRKKPDIKWKKEESTNNDLKKLQLKILSNASKYVKLGGNIVYSTCTIEKEENEEIVMKFLNQHKEFELIDISEMLPKALLKESAKKGYVQLYPNIDNIDGFFIAKMVRISE